MKPTFILLFFIFLLEAVPAFAQEKNQWRDVTEWGVEGRAWTDQERKRWFDREDQYREQLERRERFIRATFGRYLSDEIVEEILESPEGLNLGGDLREVTIMMSDIRGFTTLVEHLPPQQVVTLLNRYLGRMTDIILEYGGTIDEFLGDAVLAVFGAPKKQDDDTERALRCALAMQAAIARTSPRPARGRERSPRENAGGPPRQPSRPTPGPSPKPGERGPAPSVRLAGTPRTPARRKAAVPVQQAA